MSALSVFFFNDTATTEIYTLSLHDALPILKNRSRAAHGWNNDAVLVEHNVDRKSTRLNSSHLGISYAVFCLKNKRSTRTTNKRKSKHNAILSKEGTQLRLVIDLWNTAMKLA